MINKIFMVIPEKYNYYLFDWDGCLGKTIHAWLSTYMELYTAAGINCTPEEVVEKSFGNLEQGPKNFGIKNYEEFWEEIVAVVTKKVAQVDLYEGAYDLLKDLKAAGKKIAIVTSSERKIISPALAHNKLDKLVDVLVTEGDVSKPKPDPEMVELAIKNLRGNKKESIIIGDTGKDILAGQNAGIDQILVLHEENKQFYDFDKLKETNPTYIAKNLNEIFR